jgi:four helix bundle protein
MIIEQALIDKNPVLRLSLDFSINILAYSQLLYKANQKIIADQLTRCGTSVGANIFESQNAESRPDFIHKMKIAAKELDESIYWLILCRNTRNYPDVSELINTAQSLGRLLGKIISSSKLKGK